jgi:hypothetical protein
MTSLVRAQSDYGSKYRRLLLTVVLGLLTFAADATLAGGREAQAYVYRPHGLQLPASRPTGIRPGPHTHYDPAKFAAGHRYFLAPPPISLGTTIGGWYTLRHDPRCPACAQNARDRRSLERHTPR